ncbi:MAG: hypothetical protein OEZ05_14245, partial [Nitrospirota bacterium]|nr:hypothetical protein [Nitrospirota bacterium]
MRKILIFLSPFIVIGLAFEFALWKTGDLWTPQFALHHQQKSSKESIYGPRFFSDQFNIYKLSGIRYRQPWILAIGSSRVMQIRDIMFSPMEAKFYNGGGILRNALDLETFAAMLVGEELPLPKVLIVGLDPWWLRTNYGSTTWLHDPDEHLSFAGHIEAFRQTFKKGAFKKVITATSVSESPHFGYETIGTSARIEGAGFRKDGSSLYPPNVFLEFLESPQYIDRESPAIIDRILTARREFALPAEIDEKRVKMIIDALALIQKKGVEIVAFMPPFSTEAFEAIENSQPLRQWWTYYKTEFPKLLKKHHILVVSVSHPGEFHLQDTSMFDGWHPSEVFIGHLMAQMLK